MFSSSQYFSPLATQVFPHLFFFSFLPPHKQVHVKAAGEALKIVKVPKTSMKAGKADEAGEAFKVKGVKIHAKKSKGDGEAVAGEAAAVKHTPKKTAKFAEKVAKLDAKKVKGGVSTCFAFFCLPMGRRRSRTRERAKRRGGVGDIFTPKTLRRCRALFSEEKNSSSFFLTPTPPPPLLPPPSTHFSSNRRLTRLARPRSPRKTRRTPSRRSSTPRRPPRAKCRAPTRWPRPLPRARAARR